MPRVAVVGAGGIGAMFGGRWRVAGHQVLFCTRRPFSTLIVESAVMPMVEVVDCVVEPGLVPLDWCPAEWVFVAVKANQTLEVAPWLDRLVGPATHVVALQNGLDSAAQLGSLVGSAIDVLDTVVYCGAESVAPGRVRHGGGLDLVVPEGSAAQALLLLSAGTGITVTPVADFVTSKWRKVLLNCAANGITALARRPMGLFARDDAAQLAADVLAEGLDVARACGADLSEDDTRRILDELRRPEVASVRPSMLQDRLAARPTEHDAIYGAVARAADEHGLIAPLHRFLQRLLAAGEPC